MYVIRPTRPLLMKLGIRSRSTTVVTTTTALGDWFLRTHNAGRRRLLLCTSSKSLLTVLITARELAAVSQRLRSAVGDLLFAIGAPLAAINRELDEMHDSMFGFSNDRRVIGSMTDMACMADGYLRDGSSAEHFVVVGMKLAQSPCRPLAYDSPERVALALLRGTA